MNENKQNTTLLTVIAVATLLVAVVGATFAYFTAASTEGSTSQVTVNGGKLAIAYGDGSAWVNTTVNPIEPSLDNVVATKDFTVSATYNVNLDVWFEIKFEYSTQFKYPMYVKLTDRTAEEDIKNGTQYADTYVLNNKASDYSVSTGTGSKQLSTAGHGANSNDPEADKFEPGTDTIADGYFKADNVVGGADATSTISLRLEIFYPDNGENQDDDKTSNFNGKLQIYAKNATTTTTAAAGA